MKNFLFDKKWRDKLVAILIASGAAFLLFPVFYDAAIYPLKSAGPGWLSLDPSWHIALNYMNVQDLQWGTDVVFTYGPLSFLSTRVGQGVSKFSFVLFDLFVAFNFFYIFYVNYRRSENKLLTLLLIGAICLLLPIHFGSGVALVLAGFLLFWMRESIDRGSVWNYLVQLTIVVLLFFIKFNTGLTSIVFFLAIIIYRIIFTKENRVLLAGYVVVLFVVIFLLAGYLNVSLPGYLKGGLNMVSGYNEIMYLDESYINEFRFCLLAVFISVFVLLRKFYFEKEERFKNLLTFFIFCGTAFTLYKQSFTRADIQHVLDFYKFFLLFVLCISDFQSSTAGRNTTSYMIAVIFIVFFFGKKRDDHLFNFSRILKNDYVAGIRRFNDSSGVFLFPNDNQLPQRIKEKIGQQGTDIYPWNIQLLFENRLNYAPRPVFQSYTAYTPYLEKLNFGYYNSDKAPAYVLYEYESIDGRYPLGDEPLVQLALLKRYNCVDTFSFFNRLMLLLERKKDKGKVEMQRTREFEIDLNERFTPQENMYYEFQISNNLLGKAYAVFRSSPELNMGIEQHDGNVSYYRTSKKLLETGLFLNTHLRSTHDFFNLINADSVSGAQQVKSIQFLPVRSAMFDKRMTVREYKILGN